MQIRMQRDVQFENGDGLLMPSMVLAWALCIVVTTFDYISSAAADD